MSKIPLYPTHPERVCWGCDKYCPAESLDCGNGTVRTQHPIEIFGTDWLVTSDTRVDSQANLAPQFSLAIPHTPR